MHGIRKCNSGEQDTKVNYGNDASRLSKAGVRMIEQREHSGISDTDDRQVQPITSNPAMR